MQFSVGPGTLAVWVGYGARVEGQIRVGVSRRDIGLSAPWNGDLPDDLTGQWRVEVHSQASPIRGICLGLPRIEWLESGAKKLTLDSAEIVGCFVDLSAGLELPGEEPWTSTRPWLDRLGKLLVADDSVESVQVRLHGEPFAD